MKIPWNKSIFMSFTIKIIISIFPPSILYTNFRIKIVCDYWWVPFSKITDEEEWKIWFHV